MKIRFFKSFFLLLGVFIFFLGVTAKAEAIEVSQPTDFWFQYETDTVFIAQTQEVTGFWSDPMLWLYNSDNELVAFNDDYYSLQSHLELTLPAGTYRLRAGVCCGNPENWWNGVKYTITIDGYIPQSSTTMDVWTTTTETPTSSSLTSSTTTTTQPVLTTTTSTTSLPPLTTLTVLTTTSSVATTLPPVVTMTTIPNPPSSSLPSTTTTTAPFVTVTPTTLTSSTTTSLDLVSTTTNPPIQIENYEQSLAKVYVKKVGIGPIHITLKVSGKQRRTVIVTSIVQVTTIASMSVPGVSTGGVTSRRRR